MDNPTPTIPSEISDQLLGFHEKLEKLEGSIKPLISNNINSSDLKLSSMDRARLNLTSGYALNSLFWMYLNTLGVNPKEHPIKTELERYKSYMQRLKEIADKVKAPVLDSGAAKRFVRNALWDPKDKNESENPEESSEAMPIVGSKRPNASNELKKRRRHQK